MRLIGEIYAAMRGGGRLFFRSGRQRVELMLHRIDTDANFRRALVDHGGYSTTTIEIVRRTGYVYFKVKSVARRLLPRWGILRKLGVYGFFEGRIRKSADLLAEQGIRFDLNLPMGILRYSKGSGNLSGWAIDLEEECLPALRGKVGGRDIVFFVRPRPDIFSIFQGRLKTAPMCGFFVDFDCRTGIEYLEIEIRGRDEKWHPVYRTFIFTLPGLSRFSSRLTKYEDVSLMLDERAAQQHEEIATHIDVIRQCDPANVPTFDVLVDLRGFDGDAAGPLLKSIDKQLWAPESVFALRSAGDVSASSKDMKSFSKFEDLTSTHCIVVTPPQTLKPLALYEFACALLRDPEASLIYCDEEIEDPAGAVTPFYKPGWSPDYLEAYDYIGRTACFSKKLLNNIDGFESGFDLLLKATDTITDGVLHVPKILVHSKATEIQHSKNRPGSAAADIAALNARLVRTGRKGSVEEHAVHKGCYVTRLTEHSAKVSIVIPTAGRRAQLRGEEIDLITNVVQQIRQRSTYQNLEIIVVDNGDLSSAQKKFLQEMDCKRVTYKNPIFNVAKKLNLGAKNASGNVLLLLNDDIEIIEPSWIEFMLDQLAKPGVGVVGARLLYPDGLIQHAGVVHIQGNPDHVRRGYPGDEAGYFFSTCAPHNFVAVTGACMMTPTSLYQEIGGYSERLAVSYNDADYCMKARAFGKRCVYEPSAVLTHMESISRVASADPLEVAHYHEKWAGSPGDDPFYNQRFLTIKSPTFDITYNPRQL